MFVAIETGPASRHGRSSALARRVSAAAAAGLAMIFGGLWPSAAASQEELTPEAADSVDWREDWAVAEGLKLEVDSRGYRLPSAVALVPSPGPAPDDPFYFVTELRGDIKVVTNDRSVHTFARLGMDAIPERELPAMEGEIGMAGICLHPPTGEVFVTFTYFDDGGVLRNGMARFDTKPFTFGVRPTGRSMLVEMFERHVSSQSHQIGPCAISDGNLLVSIGDGHQPLESRDLDSPLGKVLRMTRAGGALPDNPFYRRDDGPESIRNRVFAYGFRNPFSLKVVDGRVFVTDNGMEVDRFLEVAKGGDYMWDGTDWSIGTNTPLAITPGVGPVQMDYVPPGHERLPDPLRGKFLLATSGKPAETGPGSRGAKGVVALSYDMAARRMAAPPQVLMKYRGSGRQSVVGLQAGPDGVYVVPLFPGNDGASHVLRLVAGSFPYGVGADVGAEDLMNRFGCFGCHALGRRRGGTLGPALDAEELVPRVESRLASPSYLDELSRLDQLEGSPFVDSREAREAVRRGRSVRTWVKHKILQPKFDNPTVQMPDLGLSEAQATAIADSLVPARPPPEADASPAAEPGLVERLKRRIMRWLPELRYRYLAYSFILGAVTTAGALLFLRWLRARPR